VHKIVPGICTTFGYVGRQAISTHGHVRVICDLCFDNVEIVISEQVLKIMYIKEEVLQRYTYTI